MRSCNTCAHMRDIGYHRYVHCKAHNTTVAKEHFCTDHRKSIIAPVKEVAAKFKSIGAKNGK